MLATSDQTDADQRLTEREVVAFPGRDGASWIGLAGRSLARCQERFGRCGSLRVRCCAHPGVYQPLLLAPQFGLLGFCIVHFHGAPRSIRTLSQVTSNLSNSHARLDCPALPLSACRISSATAVIGKLSSRPSVIVAAKTRRDRAQSNRTEAGLRPPLQIGRAACRETV